MRKLIILVAAAIFAAGCGDGNVYEEYYGPVTESEVLDAPWDYWELNQEGTEYFVGYNVPAITSAVCNSGMVEVYAMSDVDNYVSQNKMPYVRHYVDPRDGYTWTETVSYAFERGSITFYATRSDFVYDPDHTTEPGNYKFRVVTTEPY
jgi:ribonucleotide monophosphatase NagD (HAD superfamily)